MKVFTVIGALCLSFVLLSTGWAAECPVGKSPVVMTTPSGKVHELCVPDTAVTGLEHAIGGSGVNITGTCPCFEEKLLQSITSSNFLGCKDLGSVGFSDGLTDYKALGELVFIEGGYDLIAEMFDVLTAANPTGDGYPDYCQTRDYRGWIDGNLDKMRCNDLLQKYCGTGPPRY